MADDKLGGVDTDLLKEVARGGHVHTPDQDPVSWDPEWISTFVRWDKTGEWMGAVVLVFTNSPSVLGYELKSSKIFDLSNEPRPEPGVYLVGRPISSNAWRIENSGLGFQPDCTMIESSKLGHLPTIVLGRESGRMRFYRDGVGGDGSGALNLDLSKSESVLTEQKLADAMSAFELEHLNSQEMRRELWEDARQWIPIKEAEVTIQEYVLVALRVLFRTYTVLAETNLPIGRSDLWLVPRALGVPTRALLELKVLRSFSSGGTPISESQLKANLMGGRTQVRTYGAATGSEIKFLCSYDMRKEKAQGLLDEIATACAGDSVRFKHYPVMNDSASVRNTPR